VLTLSTGSSAAGDAPGRAEHFEDFELCPASAVLFILTSMTCTTLCFVMLQALQ
jgi:hypothetical protein